MKKKIISKAAAVLAAAVLAFGLVACGENDTTENTQDTTITENTTDTDDSANTDDTETVDNADNNDESADADNNTDDADASAGAETITFTIEVTDNEGNTTSYTGITSDEFLFDALDDVEGFTYDGVEESWGYNITTVNGLLADYNTDGAYWALYVNGEYGQNGVQTQPVEEGAVYGFVYDASAAAN